MKRILWFVVLVLLAFLLTACGSGTCRLDKRDAISYAIDESSDKDLFVEKMVEKISPLMQVDYKVGKSKQEVELKFSNYIKEEFKFEQCPTDITFRGHIRDDFELTAYNKALGGVVVPSKTYTFTLGNPMLTYRKNVRGQLFPVIMDELISIEGIYSEIPKKHIYGMINAELVVKMPEDNYPISELEMVNLMKLTQSKMVCRRYVNIHVDDCNIVEFPNVLCSGELLEVKERTCGVNVDFRNLGK
jgi:hypothetical protein